MVWGGQAFLVSIGSVGKLLDTHTTIRLVLSA